MIDRLDSLQDFQNLNKEIYSLTDDRNYTSTDLLSYLHCHITKILKAVRKEKYVNVGYNLCMGFSWAFAVANRFHICVADEMWKRFPGKCPYCGLTPCVCKERRDDRQDLPQGPLALRPVSVADWQRMFDSIYPNNTIKDSAIHLAEEIGELSEAVRNYLAVHGDNYFDKIAEEMIDIFANLMAVANCLKLDLGSLSADYFAKGCPKCERSPCECGYVAIDHPIKPS